MWAKIYTHTHTHAQRPIDTILFLISQHFRFLWVRPSVSVCLFGANLHKAIAALWIPPFAIGAGRVAAGAHLLVEVQRLLSKSAVQARRVGRGDGHRRGERSGECQHDVLLPVRMGSVVEESDLGGGRSAGRGEVLHASRRFGTTFILSSNGWIWVTSDTKFSICEHADCDHTPPRAGLSIQYAHD